MPQFRCNACGQVVDGMLFKCPNRACPKPIGGGFTEVKDSEAPSSPAVPTASSASDPTPPTPVTQSPPVAPPPPVPQPPVPQPPMLTPPPPPAEPPIESTPPTNAAPPPAVTRSAPPSPAIDPQPETAGPATSTPTQPPMPVGPPEVDSPPKPRPERLLWSYRLPGQRAHFGPSRSGPALDAQGRLLAALHDCLLCFAPGSSEPQWTYPAGARISGSPAVGPDGHTRVHSADGRLHLIAADGQPVVAPIDVGKPLGCASPLVDADNNTWICRAEGGLIKIDAAGQMTQRPYFRSRHRLDCTGLIHQNTLFLGCENHYVVAIPLDAATGRNAWIDSVQLGRTGCPIHCPLAFSGQQEILVVSQDNTLYAFGLDGTPQWSFPLDGHVLSSPVVAADDIVYIAVNKNPLNQPASGTLIAIHTRSRSQVWEVKTAAPIESTPVLGDDGMIYLGDNRGTIHAVDHRGQTVWTAEFDSPIRSGGTIIAEQQLAFLQDDGTLIVLECSSNHLNPGPWPKLLGTAQQTGQTTR